MVFCYDPTTYGGLKIVQADEDTLATLVQYNTNIIYFEAELAPIE